MTIRLRLYIGFLVLIIIFLVDFVVNQHLSQEVIRNTEYLSNSEAVIRNSNLLHKNMIEMQSGFRGYLLTGVGSFLDSYYKGLETVSPLFKEQKSLVNAQEQNIRLDSIMNLHKRWVMYANSLIGAKKDTTAEASFRYQELFEKKLKMEVGKKLNDEIENLFIAFDSDEYSLRQKRRAALQESISQTRNITLSLTIFSIVVALISCFYIIKLIANRISHMVQLADEIAKGNFKKISDNKNDELEKLSESLNIMSETLEKNFEELTKKNKELDQFAYVVSHDLKAPLRGIDNISKWIEEDHEDDLTPALKKHLELIKGRTKRLENMINGLLDYARAGRVNSNTEKVNVQEMITELVEELVPSSFTVNIKTKMPVLTTEKLRLEQVFSNLLSNAVKYHDKNKGEITISSYDLGDMYEFSVSDNGPGIQAEYHDKIFMVFQTLKERDAFESTGVGLAIVKKIIDEQKMKIVVESEISKGTTFKFTWPKYKAN